MKCDWRLEQTRGQKPSSRSGGRWIAVDHLLVALGGFVECFDKDVGNQDHVFYKDIYTFDTETHYWEKKNPRSTTGEIPGMRVFMGGASYKKKKTAVFFGGTLYNISHAVTTSQAQSAPPLFKVYDDLWEYDPIMDTLSQRAYSNAGPGPRLGAEIVIKEDMLYLLGGYDHTLKAHNDFWRYNLLTNTWYRLRADDDPASPSKRYIFRFDLNDSEEDIYIYGGNHRENGITIQRSDLWKYNIATDKFVELLSEKETNITGRTHGASAVLGNTLLLALGDVHGGHQTNQASSAQNPTKEVWAIHFNPEGELLGQWEPVSIDFGPSPLKRVFYAKAKGRLYVTLGFDYTEKGAIYNLETYSLALV